MLAALAPRFSGTGLERELVEDALAAAVLLEVAPQALVGQVDRRRVLQSCAVTLLRRSSTCFPSTSIAELRGGRRSSRARG